MQPLLSGMRRKIQKGPVTVVKESKSPRMYDVYLFYSILENLVSQL